MASCGVLDWMCPGCWDFSTSREQQGEESWAHPLIKAGGCEERGGLALHLPFSNSFIRGLTPMLQRSSLLRQKQRTHSEKSAGILESEGHTPGIFCYPFYLTFSPLNRWGSFWLGVEYISKRGLSCGLGCTRLHQLLVPCICPLKPPDMHSKYCFLLNLPSLDEPFR